LDSALQRTREIDAVAFVHHETTTGLLNPAVELARTARDHGRLAVVDAISSFGAEDLPLDDGCFDFVTCTSNKCLHGLPGAAFALVSPRGQARAAGVPVSSVYLNLAAMLVAGEEHNPQFTPAIPALRSLNQALDELLLEGVAERRQRYAERAEYL